METIIDKDGNEIAIVTPEAAKAQSDAAVAAAVAAEQVRLRAEHETAIAAEKAHTQEKLEQFKRAQGGAELEKAAAEAEKAAAKAQIEQAQKTADEAKAAIEASKASEVATKKDYWIKSIIGSDPELNKKVTDALAVIALPETTDAEISAKVQAAINMAGIGASRNNSGGGMSFGGMVPPAVAPVNQSEKDHNYEVWQGELGIKNFIPKAPTNQ